MTDLLILALAEALEMVERLEPEVYDTFINDIERLHDVLQYAQLRRDK